ncbi:hypothetical protein TCAL_06533, partial [Tigriopus californicus]|eukprot:TCALIF_06533-PA protein Name:"Protein of unknown function" AED:0.10 eAED:0.10 QI:0/1/0/1/0.5/0.33/3/0/426
MGVIASRVQSSGVNQHHQRLSDNSMSNPMVVKGSMSGKGRTFQDVPTVIYPDLEDDHSSEMSVETTSLFTQTSGSSVNNNTASPAFSNNLGLDNGTCSVSHSKEGQVFPLARSESGHLKVVSKSSSSKPGHRRSTTSSTSPQRRHRRHRRRSAKVTGSISGSPSSSASSTSDEADLTANGRSQGVEKSPGSLNSGLSEEMKTAGPQRLSRPRRSAKRSKSQRNRLQANANTVNEAWLSHPSMFHGSNNMPRVASTGCIMDLANLQIQDGFHPAIPSPALTPTGRASKLKPLPITGKGGKIFDHPAIVLPQDIEGRELREFGSGCRKRRRPKLQRQLSLIDLEYEIEEFSIHGSLRNSTDNRSSRSPLHHRSDQNLRAAAKTTKTVAIPSSQGSVDIDDQTRFNFTSNAIEKFSEIGQIQASQTLQH